MMIPIKIAISRLTIVSMIVEIIRNVSDILRCSYTTTNTILMDMKIRTMARTSYLSKSAIREDTDTNTTLNPSIHTTAPYIRNDTNPEMFRNNRGLTSNP